jgi:alkylation response protein AidB-like acyl-CoA dehydrogenase
MTLPLNLGPELEAFRLMVGTRLAEVMPEDIRREALRGYTISPEEHRRRWQGILNELGGWGCPSWPKAFGGPGWSAAERQIFEREYTLLGAPRLPLLAYAMLGPAIMKFGTEAQQRAILPGILDGSIMVCQGYSEPNAGSDLASLSARAERRGDSYVLNGSKIWISNAEMADLMFGLFRTGQGEKKQEGISVLLVPMKIPGVTVRQIRTFDGGSEVSEVFFDNAVVPADAVLGEEGQGWTLAKIMLSYERLGTAEVSQSLLYLNELKQIAAITQVGDAALIDDRSFRQRIARVEIDLWALDAAERQVVAAEGSESRTAPSVLKIRGTEIQQEILELKLEALGLDGLDAEGILPRPDYPQTPHDIAKVCFNMRKTSIYSGANEIQRNLIAYAVFSGKA